MALLERIATLVRANLNELADRAEDPATMMKQLVLDMENQLMQVKTQLAISIADLHMLERKREENQTKAADFTRKAELALEKGHDSLARVALERRISYEELAPAFAQQLADQQTQVENLKSAFTGLESKLEETRTKCDLLIMQHRRARALGKAVQSSASREHGGANPRMDRLEEKVLRAGLVGKAGAELVHVDPEAQLDRLEKDDKIDRMLAELKSRKNPQARIAGPDTNH